MTVWLYSGPAGRVEPFLSVRKGLAHTVGVGSAVTGNLHAKSGREGSAPDARGGACESAAAHARLSGMANAARSMR